MSARKPNTWARELLKDVVIADDSSFAGASLPFPYTHSASSTTGSFEVRFGGEPPVISTTTIASERVSKPIARQAILALISAREQLGYELSHAEGLMDDEQLGEVLQSYLYTPRKIPNLTERVKLLYEIVPEKIDAELVMVVFKCSLDDAQQAVAEAMQDRTDSFESLAQIRRQEER